MHWMREDHDLLANIFSMRFGPLGPRKLCRHTIDFPQPMALYSTQLVLLLPEG
jgi:hypothetical protein